MGRETMALIEKVKRHEYLYDSSHELYKNMEKKTEAWRQIARELNISIDSAKIKWKNLRDCYIRHKKSSEGAFEVRKYLNWPWSRYMKFLDNAALLRTSVNNEAAQPEKTTPQITETPPLVEVTENSDSNQNLQPSPTSWQNTSTSPIPRKKLKLECTSRKNDIDKIIDYLKNRPSKRDFDDVDHLFLSYAETFRKFHPMNQALLKIELAELFARTEMKELGTPLSPTVVYSSSDSDENATQKQHH